MRSNDDSVEQSQYSELQQFLTHQNTGWLCSWSRILDMPGMPGINSLAASAKRFLGTSWVSERWQHSSELTAAGFCLQVIDNQHLGNFFQITKNYDLGRFGSNNLNG